jgi:hypothetical protein
MSGVEDEEGWSMTERANQTRTGEPVSAADDAASRAHDTRREAIVETRLAALAARFGDRWDEAQRAQVRRQVERQLDLAAGLRRVPLANGDEPEIVFVPYRAEEERGRGGGR